jgi:hypothetical protein
MCISFNGEAEEYKKNGRHESDAQGKIPPAEKISAC